MDTGLDLPLGNFAEILPRFISNLISHVPHIRIFSDRDPFVYWLYALYAARAGTDLGFITPRPSVRVRPPLPIFFLRFNKLQN